jgi:hypothetical protein
MRKSKPKSITPIFDFFLNSSLKENARSRLYGKRVDDSRLEGQLPKSDGMRRAGLQTGCCTLSIYRRALSTRDKETGKEED